MKLSSLFLKVTLCFSLMLALPNADSAPHSKSTHKVPEKIVALSPHSVELLFALGVGDKIVGTTEHADYPEPALKIERLGGYNGISLERLLEINPDLVVVWKSGNKKEQVEQLLQLGFNIYFSDLDSFEGVAKELVDLGKLTGSEEKANQLAADFRARLATIVQKYQHKTQVSAFYQLWSQPLRTAAGDSWIQQMLDACNANNIFADSEVDYPQVSIENVILAEPEVLILPFDDSATRLPDHINWSQWPEIPAVKNGHLYRADADLLHRTTLRSLDGLEQLCQAIDNAR